MIKDSQKAFPTMLEQQMEMEREYQTKFEFMAKSMENSEKAFLEMRESQAELECTAKSINNSGKALLEMTKRKRIDQNVNEILAKILQLEQKNDDQFEKEIFEIESVGRDMGGEADKDNQEDHGQGCK